MKEVPEMGPEMLPCLLPRIWGFSCVFTWVLVAFTPPSRITNIWAKSQENSSHPAQTLVLF